MNNCVEITVYYFPEFGGEDIDEARDVRSMLGGFTWRCEGQEVPKAFQVVHRHATFEDPIDIRTLAESIRNHFNYEVNVGESFRIAETLCYKVAGAKERMGNHFHYVHSDSYGRSSYEKELLGAD
jgi:hypothetical protein